ncbi:diguanylate cyclase [Halomonas sp. DP4Y7-1]|nr:diguanylate cyclase [Halomonas sp. DP4Y7-2]MBY6233654.1 diguanylate cyclase [Halomonas sp. DP4Y7-1]
MSPCPLAGHHGELYNLSVRRGTLNDVERFRIQEHVIQTIMMLEALPWPAHLRQVPSIAGNHHERMDGTGYPRRLKLKEASLEEKVMVMADVFEALTAADRPYKAAMTLSRALALLADMVRDGHLDPDLYRLLLEQRVYRDFAKRFLKPGQWDKVDPQALLARAGLEGDAAD